jgi:transposase-like protein
MRYPQHQLDFESLFQTEDDCISYLFGIRYKDGFICSSCSNTTYWKNIRGLFICQLCNHEHSITANTIFHKSKLSLLIHFRAIWWMIAQKNGVSAKGLQKILGLGSYRTAWVWLHKFRRLMLLPDRDKLSGIVEVDEAYVGGCRRGKRGRGSEGKVIVAIAIEKKDKATGRVRMEPVIDASSDSLLSFIKNNVYKGSTIITDEWPSYNNLPKCGYKHKTESKKNIEGDDNVLPDVHRAIALLKRWLIGTHQNYTSSDNLRYYLDEYTFRYNRRTSGSRGLLFYRIIEQSMNHSPVKNDSL